MTEQEKKLLLQDLCARLSYGVKVTKSNIIYPITGVNIALGYVELAVSERISIEEALPYLRPMSSMTEEERKEYELLANHCIVTSIGFIHLEAVPLIDWLNTHHFDYRNLIEKGLALEAPDGMYK